MPIAKLRVRVAILGIILVIVVGIVWASMPWAKHAMHPHLPTTVNRVSADTAPSQASAALPGLPDTPGADDTSSPDLAADATGHAEPYPVNLDALRARLLDNIEIGLRQSRHDRETPTLGSPWATASRMGSWTRP